MTTESLLQMSNNDVLMEKLREHLKLEEEEVAHYTQEVNKAKNAVLGILFRGILDDSKRHAHILRAIIAYFKGQGESSQPFVTEIDNSDLEDSVDPEQEENVEVLLNEERAMIKNPFIDLLLESIAIDERKHATLARHLIDLVGTKGK